jgi:hypothetical protein
MRSRVFNVVQLSRESLIRCIAVQDLHELSHRAAYSYQLESVTLDANHLPHAFGPARVNAVSDLPPRTCSPDPNTQFVRVCAAFPYVTPMVPYTPSAAHIRRFQTGLNSESMAITAHLDPSLVSAGGGPVRHCGRFTRVGYTCKLSFPLTRPPSAVQPSRGCDAARPVRVRRTSPRAHAARCCCRCSRHRSSCNGPC